MFQDLHKQENIPNQREAVETETKRKSQMRGLLMKGSKIRRTLVIKVKRKMTPNGLAVKLRVGLFVGGYRTDGWNCNELCLTDLALRGDQITTLTFGSPSFGQFAFGEHREGTRVVAYA